MSDIDTTHENEPADETIESQVEDVTILEDEEDDAPEVESAYDRPGRWYIIHTFAGHEKKVIAALANIIKVRDLGDQIYEIYSPEEDVTVFKGGKKDQKSVRMFPSYLLVRCEPDPEIFYVIGSTPGVTGFFEVTVNGELVHSKKGGEGFPSADKVAQIVAKVQSAA